MKPLYQATKATDVWNALTCLLISDSACLTNQNSLLDIERIGPKVEPKPHEEEVPGQPNYTTDRT